jgi:hypothetical protein
VRCVESVPLRTVRSSQKISYLVSPVSGSGVPVPRFQQLFLLAAQHSRRTPKDQAAFLWELVAAQGQRIMKDGKTLLQWPEQNVEHSKQQNLPKSSCRFLRH